MIYILLGVIGAIWGGIYFYGAGGTLVGGMAGVLAAAVIAQRNHLRTLERQFQELTAVVHGLRDGGAADDATASASTGDTRVDGVAAGGAAGPVDENQTEPTPPPTPGVITETADAVKPVPPLGSREAVDEMPFLELELSDADLADVSPGTAPPSAGAPSPQPPPSSAITDAIRTWFTGGNLMVRVGVVVLLFGFAFLVKYAAARNMVPLELRLTAAFAAGIALLILGWRLRTTRVGYAVSLQGCGIGVMYLTLFAAARLFQLVPLPLTLAVMVGLVVFSGLLAVLQNAAAMAVIGAAGGFMAPVLLSTGTGSHVMLFSYYALLNAGIFGIAWFKAWRWLNLIGFFFTFGIGSAWGLEYYRPLYFATTEPFLILFFAFYLTISVLFALRQPPRLKGYVDGTLVFGLPLVVFTLQTGLVRSMPYGMALSALALALVYTGLATRLWRRRGDGLAALTEAFLAMGVVFGSLAIPLALSGSWTAVTWSLEGAGLVWVGLRQKRLLARSFGLLLQLGSGLMFLHSGHGAAAAIPVFNSRFLGAMMVAAAGLVSAFLIKHYAKRLYRWESWLSGLVLAWGLAWWFAAGLVEIERFLPRRHEPTAAMSYIGISALAMGVLYRRLDWAALRIPAMGLLPIIAAAALMRSTPLDSGHPFDGWWMGVWPLLFGVHLYLLRTLETVWDRRLAGCWHLVGALAAVGLMSGEGAWWINRLAGGGPVWPFAVWGAIPALGVAALLRATRTPGRWPLTSWNVIYRLWLPAMLVTGLFGWSIMGLAMDGDPRPLPYLPLVNPLDLIQIGVLLGMVNVLLVFQRDAPQPRTDLPMELIWGAPAAAALFWMTAVVARSVHHYAGVPYDWEILFHSDLFHAAVAVLWGLIALGTMVAATRFRQRWIWFAGSGLLAVVVLKLFIVDLAGSGTISRIVSFLAVGALLLVIGFFTPLPPASSKGPSQ